MLRSRFRGDLLTLPNVLYNNEMVTLLNLARVFVIASCSANSVLAESNTSNLIERTITEEGLRTWTDNTGNHQVRGRLVGVGPRHVRIHKTTGRNTTVPIHQLGRTDVAYVARIRQPVVSQTRKVANNADVCPRPPKSEQSLRKWTDNTGQYQIQGQLVEIGPPAVW